MKPLADIIEMREITYPSSFEVLKIDPHTKYGLRQFIVFIVSHA